MRRRSVAGVAAGLALALAVAALAVIVLVPGAAPPPPVTLPPPVTRIAPGSVYWGAELGTQFTGEAVPWDMRGLSRFAAEIGRAPAVVAFNLPFENCYATGCVGQSFPAAQMTALRRYGSIPLLNWSSVSSPLTGDQTAFTLAAISSGRLDGYVTRFARQARAWGHPFFLRFDWEMNQSWFAWGHRAATPPGAFIAAWRRLHRLFTAAGATNASWVWCPYVTPSGAAAMRAVYPGGAYVDWTCLDGYNFDSTHRAVDWRSFDTLFAPAYATLTRRVAPGKPMIVGEVASAEHGGSKAGWIRDMMAEIPRRYPDIRGVVWFDAVDDHEGSLDATIPIESSAASRQAFATGVRATAYAGNAFGALAQSPIPPP